MSLSKDKYELLKLPVQKYVCHDCIIYESDIEYQNFMKQYLNGTCQECDLLNSCHCHNINECRCKVECQCLCKNENKGICEKECICPCICEDDCKTYCSVDEDSEKDSTNLCKCDCHENYTDSLVDCINANLTDPGI